MEEKKFKPLPPHKKDIPCRLATLNLETTTAGRVPQYCDAFPRDCKFAYMTPGYYATGFRILDVYKTEVDFTDMRNLMFLEDPKQVEKWGLLRERIPFPKTRVTDLPGTRDLHYNNYCLRVLDPESAGSWRKSVISPPYYEDVCEEEAEPVNDNLYKNSYLSDNYF